MPIISALAAVAARGYGFLQGPRSDFELIETQTVGAGGAASITFNSIPQTYKHLQIRGIARMSGAGTFYDVAAVFNNDTAANYVFHRVSGDGTSATSAAGTSKNAAWLGLWMAGNNAGSNIFGSFVCDILDYTNTSKNKTCRSLSGSDQNGAGVIGLVSTLWLSTSAITSIKLDGSPQSTNFMQYSAFSLYGEK